MRVTDGRGFMDEQDILRLVESTENENKLFYRSKAKYVSSGIDT